MIAVVKSATVIGAFVPSEPVSVLPSIFRVGVPVTPLLHPWDLFQADSNGYASTRGDPRSPRLPPFQQLDLRLRLHTRLSPASAGPA